MQQHPLSADNINIISKLCGNFIRERYNVSLEDSTLKQILTNIHKKNLQYFNAHPPIPSLDELNKRAISEVRDFIIQQKQQPQPHAQFQQPPQQFLQQPSQQFLQPQQFQQPLQQSLQKPLQTQQLPQHHDVNMPLYDINNFQPPPAPQLQQKLQTNTPLNNEIISANTESTLEPVDFNETSETSIRDEKNEDSFFKKLQTLELQRGQQINLKEPQNDPFPSANQQKIQAAPPQSTNTIIYMSNNSSLTSDYRNIKPVVLCGSSRMWVHIVDRNLLIFNGPLPDSVHMRLCKIMLPKRVAKNTPCVNVRIQSATDKVIEILCHLDKEGTTWDIWKPISNILSLIKTFACPWTITLYDLFNKPLEMGKDGNKITSVTRLINGNTKITVEPDNFDITSYAQILIQTNDNKEEHINILHVSQNTIELPGDYTHLKESDTYICNLQAQVYLIFEMEKQEEE